MFDGFQVFIYSRNSDALRAGEMERWGSEAESDLQLGHSLHFPSSALTAAFRGRVAQPVDLCRLLPIRVQWSAQPEGCAPSRIPDINI
jgi:hypothetical protein